MRPPLGFIGLGLMGAPMAARLVNAGYTVHIYNRTKAKVSPLIERGAAWCDSRADVARNAEIVFTMLTNDDALRGIAGQIQSGLKKDGIHIDCSTVSPALTSTLEKEYQQIGRRFLHAPVLGSTPQATDGSLLLFIGGTDAAFEKAESLFKILGQRIWRFPKAEQASSMKLIMNSFIAGMIGTLSQALVFAQSAGVRGEAVLDVLSFSALNAPMYQTKGLSLLEKNYSPRFFLENLLKDTNLFRDAARSHGLTTPIADTMRQMLEEAVSRGLGKEDYSAVIKTIS